MYWQSFFVDPQRHLAQKVLIETHIIIQKKGVISLLFEHRNIFTYFMIIFLLEHLPVWSFNSMFYQWGIINFNVFRQISEVFKTSSRYNKNLYNIYKHLQNVTFRRGLLFVVWKSSEVCLTPKHTRPVPLFLHLQVIPFLCNCRKSLQKLRSVTEIGRYFYQITIKNIPRHKSLEEKLEKFPQWELDF